MAGALLVPGSLAIISASFDESSRGQAIGTWSAFTAIAAGIGPILEWLTDRARLLAERVLHQRSRRAHRPADLFIESSRLGFGHPLALMTLLGRVILLAAFFLVEARLSNPMLPLALFS